MTMAWHCVRHTRVYDMQVQSMMPQYNIFDQDTYNKYFSKGRGYLP